MSCVVGGNDSAAPKATIKPQFRVTNRRTSRPVALVKIGVRYFDYLRRQPIPIPGPFRERLRPSDGPSAGG